ncbi:hypothetical protein HE1_00001 [Holospora elegans E1]|uniref:Uncharacterized protein n=1 Tax=Holospora elegans E1 TaxID=1427503 RepID=A0A023DX11_9PROT|nr:hypothetical protein [Holospora elegans]GAJ45692.1 hypothetical protein HE1_00001 [Holospora elegans E1]
MLEKLINQGFGSMKSGIEATYSAYSGISKRLKVIKWEYFEGIYKDLVSKVEHEIDSKGSKYLHRFDSTIINLSG